MNRNEMEQQLIQQFQRDERMMILVFAQWCVNNGLNPEELYRTAYPDQAENPELKGAIELTVPKEEAGPIEDETVLGMLAAYNNDELAFIVTEAIARLPRKR